MRAWTAALVAVAGCIRSPELPADAEAMAALAESVRVHVAPGFTVRPERAPTSLVREMDRLGVLGGEVRADPPAVVLRRGGWTYPVYVYRLGGTDSAWTAARRRMPLDSLDGRWDRARCRWFWRSRRPPC